MVCLTRRPGRDPTIMATGSASLPAHSFATGSAVVNMLRQIGLAVGVAVFIAVLGTPIGTNDIVQAYAVTSILTAAIALAAGLLALTLMRLRAATGARSPVPAIAADASTAG